MYLLARLEELVLDPGHAIGWRVWAWAKLIKVCSRLLFFEHAFFVKSGWLKEGFALLKQHAGYKRDYLMPRLNADGVWR